MINSLLMVPWYQDSLFRLNIKHTAWGKTGGKGTQTLACVAGDLCHARYLFYFFFSLSPGTASFSLIISLYPQGPLLLFSQLVIMKNIPDWRLRTLLIALFIKWKEWVNVIPSVHFPLEDEWFITIFSEVLSIK